jgi:hypothetical protein
MSVPIVLTPGSSAAVGPNLALARVFWAEPIKGRAVIHGGGGEVLATLVYSGPGSQEPQQINFQPPLAVTSGGIFCTAPGGFLQVHLQGVSGFGG